MEVRSLALIYTLAGGMCTVPVSLLKAIVH